jgi:hypothetical protein
MAEMLIHPLSCLKLNVKGTDASDAGPPQWSRPPLTTVQSGRPGHRAPLGGGIQAIGFGLILAGVRSAWPLIVVGAAVVITGFIWTMGAIRSGKRTTSP